MLGIKRKTALAAVPAAALLAGGMLAVAWWGGEFQTPGHGHDDVPVLKTCVSAEPGVFYDQAIAEATACGVLRERPFVTLCDPDGERPLPAIDANGFIVCLPPLGPGSRVIVDP